MFNIVEAAKNISKDIIEWRRDLHSIPEVGMELPKTSAYVTKELGSMGIEFQPKVGVSGIVGLIKGGKEGKTIALRADMDALPIKEETGLAFASQNKNMHACGHDAHTAMLLGAAKILNENKKNIKGNIKLIFQAGEEGPGGARPMIEEGALKNPDVDAILGLHIGSISPDTKDGQVIISYENMMACLDRFKIILKGKGCHGAYPENGVDPIVMSAAVISALQTIVSREVKATEPAVITVGKINGGFAYNIIPDSVELEGTARATDNDVRKMISKRIEEIVGNVAKAMRGDYEYEYIFGYPPLINNSDFTEFLRKSAEKVVPADDIIELKKPVMGGEDMAYFLEKVPGTFFFLGSSNAIQGECYPHHNSRFDINEEVLWKGTALLAQTAFDWLDAVGTVPTA